MAGAGALPLLLLLLAAAGAAGEPCPEPTIAPSYYTTSDAVIASESVFVVEISLVCKNGAQVRPPRVGVWGGVPHSPPDPLPAPPERDEDPQTEPHRGFGGFWGAPVSPSLPQGAWSGPWVSSEALAAAVGLVVYYLALSTKSSIQA
ncbi:translocon-associated protein subunit delta [Onychostruthus taczanowskii]|uniref:translocon-associated protein subunit delta n=1 Tax=Onychostruthus taczanowskii TaxID=356909 RepID=UPI001B80BFA6|nr:translocon-associated protein subunit delta [Onychostruthus taczanowskii]